MSGKSNYSVEDHKSAFDTYYDKRTYLATAKELGIDTHTIRRWAGGDSSCACPFHNWDRLVAEKEACLDSRLELLERGITDPLLHEQALLDADPSRIISDERREELRPAGKVMIRSETERLTQWEYLWGKVFWHATGITTDHTLLIDAQGAPLDDSAKRFYLDKGLSPRNLEGCIKSLGDIQEKINECKQNLGIKTKISSHSPDETKALEGEQVKELTLADLRAMRELYRHSDPEKVALMLQAIKADEQVDESLTRQQPKMEVPNV